MFADPTDAAQSKQLQIFVDPTPWEQSYFS